MTEKLIYPWDAETGVALPARAPQLDKRETVLAGEPVYMPCACATDEAAPEPETAHVVQRIGNAWVQTAHYRGVTVYDKETGAERKIGDNEIGIPESMTTGKPGPADKWDVEQDRWAEDDALKAEIEAQAARVEGQEAARQRVATADAADVSQADIAIALGLREPA